MTSTMSPPDRAASLRSELEDRSGIKIVDISLREYPDEVNFIFYVADEDVNSAIAASAELDKTLENTSPRCFIVVRRATPEMLQSSQKAAPPVRNVNDSRVTDLIQLVSARSRVSAAEPSLVYVTDVRASLPSVTSARHHLIFGRRGAGKSALLVEARRSVEARGSVTAWINVQTYRREEPQRVVLYALDKVLGSVIAQRRSVPENSAAMLAISQVYLRVQTLLDASETSESAVTQLIPRVQGAISRYLELEGVHVYIFLDDFYYVRRDWQPDILDMLHACCRDTRMWLKVASIKHLTKWWRSSPPTGLQTGQDAEIIDLDVTLQDPERARDFLEDVLGGYAKKVGISTLTRIFSRTALDRLVLASGAVPRDYMVLASSAISRAQQRANARQVGVQEVNQAAGDAASVKIKELEEDMASNAGSSDRTLETLKIVRSFCLDEAAVTYFLVSFHDKENDPQAYGLLTDLMDVRLIHLVEAGVSDAHSAGHRYEAYMLDLSQFSGARLKQRIRVLDFVGGSFVSRQTRGEGPDRIGSSSRAMTAILRAAPVLKLGQLKPEA